MKNKKRHAFIISIALLGAVEMMSCTHSSPTPAVSFKADIIPILASYCTINSSCHAGANSTNQETNFDSDSAYYTINKKGLISTVNPSSSLLYVEVRSLEMPLQPYAPLSASDQQLILDWIEQGAQNN